MVEYINFLLFLFFIGGMIFATYILPLTGVSSIVCLLIGFIIGTVGIDVMKKIYQKIVDDMTT